MLDRRVQCVGSMQPGTQVGAYQIIRPLGQGGMGAVYEAVHTLIGRRAAIKILLPAYSQNQEIVNRFFNEARAATAVADAGIVQIFDFGYHTTGAAYIVMEFLDGEALDARLRRVGRVHVADAARIGRQVAMALAAAHRRGIVHRDLKPENVFLVQDTEVIGGERAKVLDFGIAKLAGEDGGRSRTRTGALMGTPEYMSPEQCRGAGSIPVDHRADVYALGCILCALATGRPPFVAEGAGDLIIAHVTEPPRPPSQMVAGVTPELDAIVLRCLAKNPDDRFASMHEVAQALAAVSGVPGAIVVGTSGPYALPHPTPAPAITPLPVHRTPVAPPTAATITGAAAEVQPPPVAPPRRRRGLVIAGVATFAIAIAVTLALVSGSGGGAPSAATAPGVVSADAAVQAAVTPDGAVRAAVAPPDAARPIAPPPDAAPPPPADAAAPAAPSPVAHHHHHHDKGKPCPPDDLYCIK